MHDGVRALPITSPLDAKVNLRQERQESYSDCGAHTPTPTRPEVRHIVYCMSEAEDLPKPPADWIC